MELSSLWVTADYLRGLYCLDSFCFAREQWRLSASVMIWAVLICNRVWLGCSKTVTNPHKISFYLMLHCVRFNIFMTEILTDVRWLLMATAVQLVKIVMKSRAMVPVSPVDWISAGLTGNMVGLGGLMHFRWVIRQVPGVSMHACRAACTHYHRP